MKNFGVTLKDKVCMDVGASTGGFTDCMLQNGAVKVYSIDVGYGQLDWNSGMIQELYAWKKQISAMWYRKILKVRQHFLRSMFLLSPLQKCFFL